MMGILRFLIAFVLSLSNSLYSQTPYFLLEEYGSNQSTGDVIIEHKNMLYVAGQYIIPEGFERNIQIRQYTPNGELLKTIVWDNDLENGGLNFLVDDAISIKENSLIMNVRVSNNIHDCIIKIDDHLNTVNAIKCHYFDDNIGITTAAQLQQEEKLYISISNQENKNLFGLYDFEVDSFYYIHHNVESEDFFSPGKLHVLDQSISHVGYKGIRNDPDDRTTIIAQLMIQELDQDLNLKSEHYVGDSYSSGFKESLVSPNGEMVIYAMEGNRENGEEWLLMLRPVILSLDSNYNIKWQQTLGDTTHKFNGDYFRSMIHAKENGYLLVGQKARGPNNGDLFDGYIMRVDSLGNELWNIVTVDEYKEAYVRLNDVILTSEGHYMAVGVRIDYNGEADPWTSIAQTVFIKFDDEGNILERSSGIADKDLDVEKLIHIYPNPAADHLDIVSSADSELIVTMYDSYGMPVIGNKSLKANSTLRLDTSQISPGSYQVVLADTESEEVVSKSVVVGL